jgi:hypothetical protein
MSTESTPLAQRLLEATLRAWDQQAMTANISSKDEEREVCGPAVEVAPVAVVAVLRELGDYIDELGSPVQVFTALDLVELADSIEMGSA